MAIPALDPDRSHFLTARMESTRSRRTMPVPAWPRKDKDLVEVQLEVDWLRFSTLNHRTRAEQHGEIRRSGRDDLFVKDPLGVEAQAAQYAILCNQEGFNELKADLKDRGQQEPAIVTADGILINGNRRSAAMRSLYLDDHVHHVRYATCLVLPADATLAELVDLEAELQVAKDFKQEYSWVNEGLLIEELYNREGKNFERVAQRMHRKLTDVRDRYEKIQQVHQLVALSGGARDYVDFLENESAFDELAKHIKNKPQPEAEAVKSVYFLGTLAGVEYRKLRNLRRADADRLVRREIEEDSALGPVLRAAESSQDAVDPLDDILGDKPQTTSLQNLLQFVADKRQEETLCLADGAEVEMQAVLRSLKTTISLAADEAEEDARDQNAVATPLKRVDHAIDDLRRALSALPKARGFAEWDEAGFEERLATVEQLVRQIEAAP